MAVDAPKFPSLEFGVRIDGQEPLRYISYRGASMPNTAVDDPWKIFSRIFSTTGMTDAQLLRTLADRKSVLDFLQDDIGRLSSRFTGADKARLDAHLAGIQRIEKQLTTGTQSCASPMLPAKIDPRAMANFPMIATIQMDLMTLALTCGLTNVATFMFANSDSWQYFPWIGVNEEHHTLSHGSDSDAANTEKLVKINIWHAEQVKYIADKLAAAPDADGTTVLDNSLIVWGNELGVGNTHSYKNIPWALIGGAGGSLKMGRYLQYASQPHNNMLASIAQAFGLTDVTKFGDPAVATGMFTNMLA
jgi:hypothetical protein